MRDHRSLLAWQVARANAVSIVRLNVAAWTPPGNDSASGARSVSFGTPAIGNTIGATEDGGETLTCTSRGTTSRYGKTVWYRFQAPGPGTVVATVALKFVPNCSAAIVTNNAQYPIDTPKRKQLK